MKVRLTGDISGSRDGQPWPKRGEVMELPDEEAAALCASGLAEPVTDVDSDVEKAVPDDHAEKRGDGLTKETAGSVTLGGSEEKAPAAKKAAAKRTQAKPQGEGK